MQEFKFPTRRVVDPETITDWVQVGGTWVMYHLEIRMTPMQLAVKSYELAKALTEMSKNPGEHVTVLIGAMAIVVASTEETDAEKAWKECTSDDAKAMFIKYFAQTKTQQVRDQNGIPG